MSYSYPKEICSLCGKLKRVNAHEEGNPICGNCYKKIHREMCSVCGQERPVHCRNNSQPICATCYYRIHRKICSICGKSKPVHSGEKGERICDNCRLYEDPHRIFLKYERSARKRHLDFSLSEEQFVSILSLGCDYCGRLPKRYNGVDRIDNNRGYENGNCVPCCKPCNLMKKDMSREDFISQCRLVSAKHQP